MINISLRGMVLSKYPNISAFAKAIGWTRGRAARILNKQQDITTNDIYKITECLDLCPEMFMQLFFQDLSTKWTNKTTQEKPA